MLLTFCPPSVWPHPLFFAGWGALLGLVYFLPPERLPRFMETLKTWGGGALLGACVAHAFFGGRNRVPWELPLAAILAASLAAVLGVFFLVAFRAPRRTRRILLAGGLLCTPRMFEQIVAKSSMSPSLQTMLRGSFCRAALGYAVFFLLLTFVFGGFGLELFFASGYHDPRWLMAGAPATSVPLTGLVAIRVGILVAGFPFAWRLGARASVGVLSGFALGATTTLISMQLRGPSYDEPILGVGMGVLLAVRLRDLLRLDPLRGRTRFGWLLLLIALGNGSLAAIVIYRGLILPR